MYTALLNSRVPVSFVSPLTDFPASSLRQESSWLTINFSFQIRNNHLSASMSPNRGAWLAAWLAIVPLATTAPVTQGLLPCGDALYEDSMVNALITLFPGLTANLFFLVCLSRRILALPSRGW